MVDGLKQMWSVDVRGREHSWGFPVQGTEQDAADWRADGLTVTGPILNNIPVWAKRLGLTRPWCRVQDVWRWLRLW